MLWVQEDACCLEISAGSLICFDCLEERLEIACAKALVVVSLDDFNKQSRAILEWLGEDLQQIAVVVVVNQNLQLFQLQRKKMLFVVVVSDWRL